MAWLAIQSSTVQNWLIRKVTNKLSKDIQARISIGHVDFSLFNKMLLQNVLLKDRKQDTLVYAGEVRVNITDWFFLEDKAVLKYIGMDHVNVNLSRRDSIWNYGFLVDYFSGDKKSADKKGIELDIKELDLKHIHIFKKDEWRGENMDLRLNALLVDADHIDFAKKQALIHLLEFTQPQFAITSYDGLRPTPPDSPSAVRNDPKHLRWNPAGWDILVQKAMIADGSFKNDKLSDIQPYGYFNGNHIHFSEINWALNGLRLKQDTVTAQIEMSTKEKSGFQVNKLTAQMKFFPEAMEFAKMDLQTGKSRLRNFFAMRFRSFDDLPDFLNKVSMEGDFTDAHIDSDDISYFAPGLKDWKKTIRITGTIKGTVSELQGRHVVINFGKNTLLNGDIHIKGLPNIDQTFIEFNSNDFRTTYDDLATMVPGIRKMQQPRLDRVQWIRFKGNFNGYFRNFVTSGTIETNLGTLVSNVNMKLPANKPAVYSGTIDANNFDLGQFLDNDNIGKVSFKGKVNGNGLTSKTLSATLDGRVSHLDFNDYTYQNLQVNGTITERKFNGQFMADDSNLNVKLNGLIDFSQELPRFDFNATVNKCNLKNLHFTNDELAFNGKLRFNFTGDDIDNFLGTARIYDASILKRNNRLSFDSLTLESSIVENNKKITIVSNEFDGAIVGEFSIKELPVSFQTFLNRYYPSYIKPVKGNLATNQNFSFVITTKKVDEYLDLFVKNLKGFNNSSFTGRIDSRENLLDLNAEVPQFGYKNISFYDVKLKARGNLDSLAVESNIGDAYITDSLHFPATHILLNSFNDLSQIRVTTSANQTLNSANISARVQTLSDGIRIKFNPTTFDINGKPWSIDKNGELSFEKNIVSAEGLRISNGDQQIMVSTQPSSVDSGNDVNIDMKKINIGDFTSYFVKDDRLEGLMTGKMLVMDPLNHPTFQFKGSADQFRLDNDSIGRLQLSADYNTQQTGIVNTSVHSENKDYNFDLNGIFNTRDSTSKQPVNIVISNLADTKIDLVEKWLGGIFSNLKGQASGQLQIVGTSNNLKYLGKIKLKDASMKVNYTQCLYKIPSAVIDFKEDTVDFGSFKINDTLGNSADLVRGRLFHHSFKDLGYDFAINTSRLLLLNTKVTDNSQFYGTMIGKANITLRGPQENMNMVITGQPVDSSNIYLPTSTSRESSDADFIVWKVYGKEIKATAEDKKGTNLSVTLNLTANNYANVYVIIDPLTKDIIKANGHGNLTIKTGTTQNMDIRGKYEIDRGNYNFTFQSVFHKPFIFSENVGNYIQWTGDPYDADIGIQAVYEVDNVQFSDLGISTASTNSTGIGLKTTSILPSYRGTVLVTAKLSNKLMKPDISFEISLPPNSPIKNDPEAEGVFEKIQSDPNELNKQVAFLIVFNSFGPLTNSNSPYNANSAVGSIFVSSISGALSSILSKQFSTAFQKAFKDKSIRVNFNTSFYYASLEDNTSDLTSTTYNRTNLNLSVIKSFLNEKLTFTFGSAFDFGLTTAQIQAASVQFLPNINAEWKITPNGRVVLNFFYRDSYNYLSVSSNHTENSSGVSISYRRDLDNLGELLNGKKKEVKVKPPAPPPPASPVSTTGQSGQGTTVTNP